MSPISAKHQKEIQSWKPRPEDRTLIGNSGKKPISVENCPWLIEGLSVLIIPKGGCQGTPGHTCLGLLSPQNMASEVSGSRCLLSQATMPVTLSYPSCSDRFPLCLPFSHILSIPLFLPLLTWSPLKSNSRVNQESSYQKKHKHRTWKAAF